MIRAPARGGIGYTQNGVLHLVPRELRLGSIRCIGATDRKQFQISFRVLLNPPISSVDAMKLNTR